MKMKGFTLIELLVVIAIIAVLMGIMIPALGKAKTLAQEVVCKANLHQYKLATEMYSNENDDFMPDPWKSLYRESSFPHERERYCRWHNPEYNLELYPEYGGPLWPYLKATKASVCPLFAKLAKQYGEYHMEGNNNASANACIGGPFEPQFSYSMNTIFKKDNKHTYRRSSVKNPSKTFVWAEENMWTLNKLTTHVLNDNALLVGGGGTDAFGNPIRKSNGPDGFASFHKISTSALAVQQDTHEYKGTGVSNVLLADGSLVWASPEESAYYKGNAR